MQASLYNFHSNEFGYFGVVHMGDDLWFRIEDMFEILGFEVAMDVLMAIEDDEWVRASLKNGEEPMYLVNGNAAEEYLKMRPEPKLRKFVRWITREIAPLVQWHQCMDEDEQDDFGDECIPLDEFKRRCEMGCSKPKTDKRIPSYRRNGVIHFRDQKNGGR